MDQLGAFKAKRINLDQTAKAFHLPDWKSKDDKARIEALREIAMKAGRDPRIATLAVQVIKAAGAESRDYKGQAAALLAWTQKNVYYLNEPGERLQDPLYTLQMQHPYGDCDDMALVLAALYETCRLPWRFVLSGRTRKGKLVRWVEGTPKKRASWSHIYVIVGWPPYTPKKWLYAEPTLKGVPLGWDVVGAQKKSGRVALPELAGMGAAAELTTLVVKPGPKTALTQHVIKEVQTRLHPRNLFPVLIVGVITGAITLKMQKAFASKKKKR